MLHMAAPTDRRFQHRLRARRQQRSQRPFSPINHMRQAIGWRKTCPSPNRSLPSSN